MSEQGLLEFRRRACELPEVNQNLTEYCFSSATEAERRLFESHFLDCDLCWDEVRRLSAAVQTFRSDKEMVPMFLPTDVSTCLGLSAKLNSYFGGHGVHVLVAILLYALLYVCGLLSEVAYAFDEFGKTALFLCPIVFLWIAVTGGVGIWWDWRSVVLGSRRGLRGSLAIFVTSALLLYIGLCWFLPDRPITQMTIQAYTAQAAYFKGIRYAVPLAAVYLLVPFHFVLAIQSELRERRYRLAMGVITGERWAVTPNHAFYLGTRTLWILLVVLMLISIPMTSRLFDNLKPGLYMNLFTHLMQVRWMLYFGLAVESLMWYSRTLNELKRECMLAELARPFAATTHYFQ
jgi:hypothetical protein